MCFNLQSSLFGFVIGIFIAGCLWIRNVSFDRLLSLFIIFLSLIQLWEAWAYYQRNKVDKEAGSLIYLTLWLQIVVLGISLFYYYPSTFSSLWSFIVLLLFIFVLFTFFFRDSWSIGSKDGMMIWERNGSTSIMSVYPFPINWGAYFYLLGISIPLIYLLFTNQEKIALIFLLAYGALSLLYVMLKYPNERMTTMWCYLAVGFAFLSWFIGMFRNENNC